jgi:hypothetical protein
MKKVTVNQYEYGDYVKYKGDDVENRSRIAMVLYHDVHSDYENLTVRFSDGDYDTDYDAELMDDGDYNDMDGWNVNSSEVEHITKKQYEAELKKLNPHGVKGLPANVYFTKTHLVIDDNPITKAEAVKFAKNILTQLKAK